MESRHPNDNSFDSDLGTTREYYQELYQKHGYSPESLGWAKGKQLLRFEILLSRFLHLESPRVLDVGCGFGDLTGLLAKTYKNFSYVGIDITPEFVEEARRRHGSGDQISFRLGDFLTEPLEDDFDIVVASGTFNTRFPNGGNETFIERAMEKSFALCREGFAIDFLSDKVDYRLEHTWHSRPEDILGTAYKLSRNVLLRNDVFPFEFCVTVFKDDSFDPADTIFSRWKQQASKADRHS